MTDNKKLLFNHPEGQVHPRAPSNNKSRYSYRGEMRLLGDSEKVIKNFLNLNPANNNIQKEILNYIKNKNRRSNYVQMGLNYLRNKSKKTNQHYDFIIIGAGIHAALYNFILKKENPQASVLIIEKTLTISSTFYHLGDSLVLNSPTFSKVGLNSNVIPESFIQLSDFDELKEKPFPTAKHIFEITCMLFLHGDADILFNIRKLSIRNTHPSLSIQINNKNIQASNIIIANGMGTQDHSSFKVDKLTERVISGDQFIKNSFSNNHFNKQMRKQNISVVGDGDTANCVMEYLLPLVYPNYYYGFYKTTPQLPKKILWFGQKSKNIQDFFFSNKSRYCHSGGIIEFFWNEESPFELSTEIWNKTKKIITCIPERLKEVKHQSSNLKLVTDKGSYVTNLLINCSGRYNHLMAPFKQSKLTTITGHITFFGGHWDYKMEKFTNFPRTLHNVKIAQKVSHSNIYFIGNASSLKDLIDNSEARDGSLKYQDQRFTLTNSKWLLEHTLPRTTALAKIHSNS